MKSIRIALIAPLLSAVALAAAQNPVRDFLVTSTKAVGLLAAKPVGGPGVTSMAWSSDGRYLLMVCAGMQADVQLSGLTLTLASYRKLARKEQTWICLYDSETGKTETLWTAPKVAWSLSVPKWLTGMDKGYVVAKLDGLDSARHVIRTTKVLEINAPASAIREMYTSPESRTEPQVEVSPSPTRPVAILSILDRDTSVQPKPLLLYLIGEQVSNAKPLGLGDECVGARFCWSEDGLRPLAARDGDSAALPMLLDFTHGTATAVSTVKPYTDSGKGTLRAAIDESGALWITSSDAKAGVLAAQDAESAALAPEGRALAFLSQGVALVRPIISMPTRDYFTLREGVERPIAERRASRCFVWLMNYAKANDDHLPGNSEDVPAILKPYSDDPNDFVGLTYAYGGGARSSISNPKDTLLASFNMATGKVYLYADGNFRWESAGLGSDLTADREQ